MILNLTKINQGDLNENYASINKKCTFRETNRPTISIREIFLTKLFQSHQFLNYELLLITNFLIDHIIFDENKFTSKQL